MSRKKYNRNKNAHEYKQIQMFIVYRYSVSKKLEQQVQNDISNPFLKLKGPQ